MVLLNLILYLLFWLLLLPWNMVRTTANAVDLYVPFEIMELIRRLLVTGFLIALLAGLEVRQYLIAINVVWGPAFWPLRFTVAAYLTNSAPGGRRCLPADADTGSARGKNEI
jgi:hypothetical protein